MEHLFLWMDGSEIHLESDCCTLGVSCRPCNIDQLVWIKLCLPNGKPVYVVGLAALCQAIWCTRNVVCFEDKRIKSPTEIICMMCSFFDYWAGLQKPDMERQMKQGAESWRQQRSTSRRKSRRKATKMTGNSSFIALGDHLLRKIRPWFALTISHAWMSFLSHTMVLLGIMSHVGGHFNPFRRSVNFGTRSGRGPTTFAPKMDSSFILQ